MSGFGLRPSFSHVMDCDAEEARGRIVAAAERDPRCEVKSFPGFVCLRVPPDERRFWSPRLHVSLQAHESGGTLLQGTYGPNASMWSSFLYGYLVIASVGLFSGILGWCQRSLGMHAWALWIFWCMVAAAVVMYALGRTGRKLAAVQTQTLHHIYQQAAGCEVEVC